MFLLLFSALACHINKTAVVCEGEISDHDLKRVNDLLAGIGNEMRKWTLRRNWKTVFNAWNEIVTITQYQPRAWNIAIEQDARERYCEDQYANPDSLMKFILKKRKPEDGGECVSSRVRGYKFDEEYYGFCPVNKRPRLSGSHSWSCLKDMYISSVTDNCRIHFANCDSFGNCKPGYEGAFDEWPEARQHLELHY